ncbi:uncharacterized protein LOC142319811 [Lycorma delicatula]|uniref:uncharacterized protein LOC142319811 n=1 Tax=Lycorma delicatula TaxID=130591 RepID=UPI003F519F6A
MIHKRRDKKFFTKTKESKEASKKDDKIISLCFDFMQNLLVTRILVQDIFYLNYGFIYLTCIILVQENQLRKSVKYVYQESEGEKSANEVCSFILDYIKHLVPDTVTLFHLFSDECVEQNKNQTLIRICVWSLAEIKRFEKMYHFFSIRGHSFNTGDRDFGLIKRLIRKCDRIYF